MELVQEKKMRGEELKTIGTDRSLKNFAIKGKRNRTFRKTLTR